jgi:hypothetical protein
VTEVSKSKAGWRSFWVIAARAAGGMRVFTIDIGGEKMLPVFSFEGEGESYLRSEALAADWWPRETTAGELVSLLLGLCAGVDKVALDPLPGLRHKEITGLVSMGRRDFVHHLISGVGVVGNGRPRRLQPGRVAAPIVLNSPASKQVGR